MARVLMVKEFRRFLAPPVGWPLPLALVACSPMQADGGPEFFEKKIRPLLATNCHTCHSSVTNDVMSGFRLDSLQGALTGDTRGPAIVPWHPARETLIRGVRQLDEKLAVPPAARLPDSDVAALQHCPAPAGS